MTEDVTEDVDSGAPGSPLVLDPESSRHPQPMYKLMRDLDPIFRVERAGVIVTKHVDVEQIFKQPEIFSSAMSAADLGNIRPLIPLQIDLPEHRKYRKILRPAFLAAAHEGAARIRWHAARERAHRQVHR